MEGSLQSGPSCKGSQDLGHLSPSAVDGRLNGSRWLSKACYVGCLNRVSKSVHVLLNGIEAVLVETSTILR